MKKTLIILFTFLLLLSGCKEKEVLDDNGNLVNTEDNSIDLSLYDYVNLSINPSIDLYYDENYNVIAYTLLNEDANNAYQDVEINNKNLFDVVSELINIAEEKDYINENNTDINITINNDDEYLIETLTLFGEEYVEDSELGAVIYLNQLDDNNSSIQLAQLEKTSIIGIWVKEEWVNPSVNTEIVNINYSRTLVFMEDQTGVEALYVSENNANFVENPRTFYQAFTWTEEGTITTVGVGHEGYTGTCSYKDDDLYIRVEPDHDYYQCRYKYEIKKGKLYLYNSDTEYIVYHKVDTFVEPYVANYFGPRNLQTMNSMDYNNPKATYDALYDAQNIYWDGSTYRDGKGRSFIKDGNRYIAMD